MEKRGVDGINPDLKRLKPVAVDHAFEREGMASRRDKAVKIRKRRRLARPEIGKQDAALLHHRVGFLPHVCAEIAVVGLGWRFETLPVHIKQPAMKGAAQAAV